MERILRKVEGVRDGVMAEAAPIAPKAGATLRRRL
jgi:hypothetical protein